MRIIYASQDDLEKIALCHQNAFPDSLSSSLGKAYLLKMLEWYLIDSSRFLFFVEEENICIGYCGGMINWGRSEMGSASGMTQHSFNEAVKEMLQNPKLLLHREIKKKFPFIIKNIFMKLKRKFNRSTTSVSFSLQEQVPRAALIVIGVEARQQGKGIGSLLLKEFERKALEYEVAESYLTVLSNNYNAIKAYEKNGWKIEKVKANSISMSKYLI